MSTVEHLYTPILQRQRPDAATDAADTKDDAIPLRSGAHGSSLFWTIQPLPVRQRCTPFAVNSRTWRTAGHRAR
jgi:hypothetical protein